MSSVSQFLKKNKAIRENTFYAATKSLCDESGEPLQWEIRPMTTTDDERIRDACTTEIPIPGKPNMYRTRLNSNKYVAQLLATSVVFPDLYDAELQNSYGVKTPEDLIREMIDDSGEYTAFTAFIQKFNGFDVLMQDQVDEAKNS